MDETQAARELANFLKSISPKVETKLSDLSGAHQSITLPSSGGRTVQFRIPLPNTVARQETRRFG